MFKANKEDTKTIIKYFPKLIIKASFIRPKGTFLWTIVPLKQINLSWRWTYVVMQFFSNSFENFQDCWLMVSNNFSVFPLFIVAIISNKIVSNFLLEKYIIIIVKPSFLFWIFTSFKVKKIPFSVLDFLLEINSAW